MYNHIHATLNFSHTWETPFGLYWFYIVTYYKGAQSTDEKEEPLNSTISDKTAFAVNCPSTLTPVTGQNTLAVSAYADIWEFLNWITLSHRGSAEHKPGT